MRRHLSVVAAAMIIAAPLTFHGKARAADVLPYEAIYALRLTHASSSGGPRAAVGIYESRFIETCAGWDTKSHTSLSLTFSDGAIFTNERFFSSLEAKNGRDYSFAVLTLKNGKSVEAYKGTATLAKRGGRARYELPAQEGEKRGHIISLVLPQGTLFPAAHSLALLGSAEQGTPMFRRVVFSGSSSVGPRVLSIAIGPPLAAGQSKAAEIDRALLDMPSWRMSSAYFNLFEKRDIPNFEVFSRLSKSGVTESFEQAFRDFTVSATLQRLRRLDRPVCTTP